jgi:hypothetical protein
MMACTIGHFILRCISTELLTILPRLCYINFTASLLSFTQQLTPDFSSQPALPSFYYVSNRLALSFLLFIMATVAKERDNLIKTFKDTRALPEKEKGSGSFIFIIILSPSFSLAGVLFSFHIIDVP